MMLRIDSQRLHGVILTGLVVSVDHNPAGDTTSVTLRAIKATSYHTTYEALAAAWDGADYATMTTAWATINGSYAELQSNPTRLEA